ncbi:SMAD/FHA domain-containing protein [Gongronella butleri]|nr:SMAD/FHA domain-containing protein [Gongronella butleri]
MITAALTSTTARSFGPPAEPISTSHSSNSNSNSAQTSHLRIVPHLDTSRSLVFGVIERDLNDGTVLKIGRFTDKSLIPTRITFKSKVVSRGHAEIWTKNGKFYIRDTKSSSGTFLNHVRLSPPNQESRPFALSDGDVVQLGVDYQGGTEEIYRCVKMRLELNRPPQQRTAFSILDSSMNKEEEGFHVEECCICLYALAPCQSLFVAPCSHTFHYKCARPLLVNHPGFLCPLCRNYADLDASVAVEADEVRGRKKKQQGITQ